MQLNTQSIQFASAIALIFTAAAGSAFAQAEIIKIGHVAPLTGPNAHLGSDMENGAVLAIEELNNKGIMLAGKKVTFALLKEDDGSDIKMANDVAQKLVDKKVSGVVGHLNSGTTIPASKIYFDAHIPQITPASTNPRYTQQGFNTTFRIVTHDGQLGAALGRYAIHTFKAKKIAVIDDRTVYGQGLASEFSQSAKAAGATIVATVSTNHNATDYTAILSAIKAKKPDVIFFGGMDTTAGPMLHQLKQLGIKAKFMGGDGMCTTDLQKFATDGLQDNQVVCAIAGGVVGADQKKMGIFKAAYQKKFHTDIVLFAPYSYDATMTLVDAMQKANSSDPKKYLSALEKIERDGVTGHIAFDGKGDIKNGNLTVYTYKDGKRTQLVVTQ